MPFYLLAYLPYLVPFFPYLLASLLFHFFQNGPLCFQGGGHNYYYYYYVIRTLGTTTDKIDRHTEK